MRLSTTTNHRYHVPRTLALQLLLTLGLSVTLAGSVLAQEKAPPPRQEVLLEQQAKVVWRFEPERNVEDSLLPAVGETSLPLPTKPQFTANETPVLQFDGKSSCRLPDSALAELLPVRTFSVQAWVRVDRFSQWGGLIGVLQDNGGLEQGWLLGMQDSHFCFALATRGADDGDGLLTYLKASELARSGKWTQVVATYDGAVQAIYLDGQLAGSSKVQSGDILYPDSLMFEVAAYRDSNEYYPLRGALHSVALWDKALDANEVKELYVARKSQMPPDLKPTEDRPWEDIADTQLLWTEDNQVGDPQGVLATTQQLLRPAGTSVAFPGRPVDLAVLPDGLQVVVKDNKGLCVIDRQSWRVVQQLRFPAGGGSRHGILVDPSGKRLWATTAQDQIFEAEIGETGRLAWKRQIRVAGPGGAGASDGCGMAYDSQKQRLYVCLSRNNALAEVDLNSGEVIREIPVGVAPYDVVLLDEQRAVVSNWGGRHPREGESTATSAGTPVLIDERGVASSGTVGWVDLEAGRQTKEIATGLHPGDLVFDRQRQRLYVANANSDTVTVIDSAAFTEIESIEVRPDSQLPFGSASNALALHPDGQTLFVANGGNNAIAVVGLNEASQNRVQGFIPTAWYPAGLAWHDDCLLVANVKGFGSRAGKDGEKRSVYEYLGVVSRVDLSTRQRLPEWTDRVFQSTRVPQMLRALERDEVAREVAPRPVPGRLGEPSVFEHVVYVIKENRTYDQVFGDLPQGNGDPALCIYGREITPNHHALAEEFVLLDNFYCNGVNSADGHSWSTEGNVTDHLEKAFGGFTRSYTFGDDPLTYSSSGFIWDNVLLSGNSFRNYGELDYAEPAEGNPSFTEILKDFRSPEPKIRFRQKIGIESLARYSCPDYPGWNMKIPDVLRANVFLRELRAAEESGQWPNFMIVYLPQDHTSGMSPGMPTPQAHMADNDLAVGQIIDGISHSRFWPKTCVFVIEDDPQNGFDHVDGHRSLCLVASPYTKRGKVVHDFYNQTAVLHTMERILGCPPMNQLDAMSPLMSACFQDEPDFKPYDVRPVDIPLDRVTATVDRVPAELRHLVELTLKQDLEGFDRADDDSMNRILWHQARGAESPYPAEWAGAHGRGLAALGLERMDIPFDDDDDD